MRSTDDCEEEFLWDASQFGWCCWCFGNTKASQICGDIFESKHGIRAAAGVHCCTGLTARMQPGCCTLRLLTRRPEPKKNELSFSTRDALEEIRIRKLTRVVTVDIYKLFIINIINNIIYIILLYYNNSL